MRKMIATWAAILAFVSFALSACGPEYKTHEEIKNIGGRTVLCTWREKQYQPLASREDYRCIALP